ncbi:MAG: HD domain-containing protein [Bacillota bacterium]|nr:HD domain-containing protein [Bacillota bacterium]
MSKQFVKDLKIGSHVQTQFVVVDVKELSFSAPSKSGEHFLKMLLGDISGTIKAIIWDRSMVSEPIRLDDVLYVSGEVGDYYGPQLVIDFYSKVEKDKINRNYFQPTSPRDIEEMWSSLLKIISETVADESLKSLLESFCNDSELVEKYKLSPAAKVIHHNYLGGLLDHTLEVVQICEHLAGLYPLQLDKSLLITAAIFHDLGKIEEYNADSFTFEQTDKGRLLGHITIGLEIIRKIFEKVPAFPDDLRMKLEHMIISHHGEKSWGSPEIPQTFNAFALFHADMLSARLKQFSQIIGNHNNSLSNWTDYDRFLDRRIYNGK